jgi:hypothetical protein
MVSNITVNPKELYILHGNGNTIQPSKFAKVIKIFNYSIAFIYSSKHKLNIEITNGIS